MDYGGVILLPFTKRKLTGLIFARCIVSSSQQGSLQA
jgi:hypothetical protein